MKDTNMLSPTGSGISHSRSRLCILYNLLFFVCTGILSCRNHSTANKGIAIGWKDGQPVSVAVPEQMLPVSNTDSLLAYTKLRLEYSNTDILGSAAVKNGWVFSPLVPFTQGQVYRVFYKQTGIGSFTVTPADTAKPELARVYPETDTVPVNLLKIYLQFSQPMQENRSADMVKLIDNGGDTMKQVFLDLQPELWNKDRTVLTLWLDPGRIKRALQPNERLGAPLAEKARYTLYIPAGWKNTHGLAIGQSYRKTLVTGGRDSLLPDPMQWQLSVPAAGTSAALSIGLNKTLDHFLLQESISIQTADGKKIPGSIKTGDKDRQVRFIPAQPWQAGSYSLVVDAKLEDLAGNNLNRPFDRDMKSGKAPARQEWYRRDFRIY
ncbi:Ig-like domain-containing protein [Sediminibacterium soli]|uniref:Ig-like domain-containing protein n=1 Tax=Sediminibacterium soli TaxID=2698829 RepID=UPI001379FC7E|nr:Ig-like domain-containing protein [Sediminibacterium soli]NCI46813.1 Ig-like domain-containing protein [Sediminibacterium soli]